MLMYGRNQHNIATILQLKIGFFFFFFKQSTGDFLGSVVKNLTSSAGDLSSIPGWGTKILHAAGQLGPCATTTEPVECSGTCKPQQGSHVPQLRPDTAINE